MLVGGACAVAFSSGNVGDAGCALWLGMAAVDPLNGLNVLAIVLVPGSFVCPEGLSAERIEVTRVLDTARNYELNPRGAPPPRSCNPNSLITKAGVRGHRKTRQRTLRGGVARVGYGFYYSASPSAPATAPADRVALFNT